MAGWFKNIAKKLASTAIFAVIGGVLRAAAHWAADHFGWSVVIGSLLFGGAAATIMQTIYQMPLPAMLFISFVVAAISAALIMKFIRDIRHDDRLREKERNRNVTQ